VSNEVDDNTIKEFLEYYSGTAIPNPAQYPKRFKFMIEAFLHHKKMETNIAKN
jgi:hypothetical protein